MKKLELIKIREETEPGLAYEEYTLGEYNVEVTYKVPNKVYHIGVYQGESNERYLPSIYYRRHSTGGGDFEIQTTAYGAMQPHKIAELVEAYNYAIEAANVLMWHFGDWDK